MLLLTRLRLSACLLSLVTLACVPVWAQRAAALAGTITDASGSAMVGVNVTATNTQTGVVLSTRTNESGLYRFEELVIGPYRVEASQTGFNITSTTVNLEAAHTT